MTAVSDAATAAEPDIRGEVRRLREKGLALCRLKPGAKRPSYPGWPTKSLEADDFRDDDNVGIVTGWPSDGGTPGFSVVAVDLDSPEAIKRAAEFLPPTDLIDGRPGAPGSHWIYRVRNAGIPPWAVSAKARTAAVAVARGLHSGPRNFSFKAHGKEAFKLSGTGAQIVCAPSRHHSGEVRGWKGGTPGTPAVVEFGELWDCLCKLAEGVGAKPPRGFCAIGAVDPPARSRTNTQHKLGSLDTESGEPADDDDDEAPRGDIPPEWYALLAAAENRGAVVIAGRAHPFDERFRRAAAWLDAIPDDELSRIRHGGSNRFFRHLRSLSNDFLIRDDAALAELAERYNARLRTLNDARPGMGFEEWTGDELEHKLADALDAELTSVEPGRALNALRPDGEPFRPCAWNHQGRLADGFLKTRQVRFIKDTPFLYDGRRYLALSDKCFDATVREYVNDRAKEQFDYDQLEWATGGGQTLARLLADRDAVSGRSDDADRPREYLEADRKKLTELNKQIAPLENIGKARAKGVPAVNRMLVAETICELRARRQLPDDSRLDTWLAGEHTAPVLCVENGLLDPVARTMTAHTPDWFSTVALPVVFDPAAPTPAKWVAFLNEVMEGDAERIAILQEVAGACLDVTRPGKWFAMLVGNGDNGKSVFLNVLRALLGGTANCSAVALDALTSSRHASFGMFGKLANLVGDQGYFDAKCCGKLKELTGGDLIAYEQKNRDVIYDENRAKLVFACNDPPTFADRSAATWNRLQYVPFFHTVPADRKNPALLTAEYWLDELPGVLNWALDGLARYRVNNGFTKSEVCAELNDDHRSDSNPARAFLLSHYAAAGTDDSVITDAAYAEYEPWARAGNYKPVSMTTFGKEIGHTFPKAKRKQTRPDGKSKKWVWSGVRKL